MPPVHKHFSAHRIMWSANKVQGTRLGVVRDTKVNVTKSQPSGWVHLHSGYLFNELSFLKSSTFLLVSKNWAMNL